MRTEHRNVLKTEAYVFNSPTSHTGRAAPPCSAHLHNPIPSPWAKFLSFPSKVPSPYENNSIEGAHLGRREIISIFLRAGVEVP